MPPEKGGGDHGSPIKPASGFCLFRMPATLSDLAEAVFYLVLLCCLLLSVAVTIRSFIATGSNVTNFELRDVNQHVHPCKFVCKLRISLNIVPLFGKKGVRCYVFKIPISLAVELVLYRGDNRASQK